MEKGEGKMAAYAKIYGFRLYGKKEIRGNEDDFIGLGNDCYISYGDYEMLVEIIEKEN